MGSCEDFLGRSPGLPRALITGITGQAGSYLAERLLADGYVVHGVIRRSSSFNTGRIDHLYQDPHVRGRRLHLHYGDLVDGSSLSRILKIVKPDEVYNLAAQSHVKVSFDAPEYTVDVGALGTLRLLDAMRDLDYPVRAFQASSSEMFGGSPPPQSESTPFHPRSPYAVAKVAAFWTCVNYREAYGVHVCNGILFNYESPRRGETFVTRKVTRAVARIKLGRQDKLFLGNLEARRDWGYAPDSVDAMVRTVRHPDPGDYVVATGESHSVREWVEAVFAWHDLDWERHVEIDRTYFRPTEVDALRGDASKAKRVLGWEPTVRFKELVEIMAKADYEEERRR